MKTASINDFFNQEFDKQHYFKKNAKKIVKQHIEHSINLNESKNLLSTEEKKALQLDDNLEFTKELLDIFEKEHIIGLNPKLLLSNLFHKIRTLEYKKTTIDEFKKAGVLYFKLKHSCDEKTCKGCESLSERIFSIDEDINEILEHTCTSAYCRCFLQEITQAQEDIENTLKKKTEKKGKIPFKLIFFILALVSIAIFMNS
ncbi:MAG: hypothetical protein COA66_07535 [Arcobacter sp.]|nr:MAG: hypothetical protein COA66_07535 [Arcobacter sp.]